MHTRRYIARDGKCSQHRRAKRIIAFDEKAHPFAGWHAAFGGELSIDPADKDACFNLAVLYMTQQPPSTDLVRRYYARAIGLGAERDAYIEEFLKGALKTTAL